MCVLESIDSYIRSHATLLLLFKKKLAALYTAYTKAEKIFLSKAMTTREGH